MTIKKKLGRKKPTFWWCLLLFPISSWIYHQKSPFFMVKSNVLTMAHIIQGAEWGPRPTSRCSPLVVKVPWTTPLSAWCLWENQWLKMAKLRSFKKVNVYWNVSFCKPIFHGYGYRTSTISRSSGKPMDFHSYIQLQTVTNWSFTPCWPTSTPRSMESHGLATTPWSSVWFISCVLLQIQCYDATNWTSTMFDLLWNGCTSIGTLKLHFSQRLQYLSLFWLRHLCRIQIPVKSRLSHINVVHPILNHPNFTINGWYHPPQSWRFMPYCIRFLAVFDGESGPCSTPHRLDFKLEFLWLFQVAKDTRYSQWTGSSTLPTISLVWNLFVGYSHLGWQNPHFFYPFFSRGF